LKYYVYLMCCIRRHWQFGSLFYDLWATSQSRTFTPQCRPSRCGVEA